LHQPGQRNLVTTPSQQKRQDSERLWLRGNPLYGSPPPPGSPRSRGGKLRPAALPPRPSAAAQAAVPPRQRPLLAQSSVYQQEGRGTADLFTVPHRYVLPGLYTT
jgi:hypothetical protein